MTDIFSFRLSDEFIGKYENKDAPWGFKDAGNNSLGEITFIRTYSRVKQNGTKERWHEVCRRVIEGMYSIQKDWAKSNRLPWSDRKAQASAQEAYERMFSLKWTPPGRGLWMMGAPLVMEKRNSAALQNCGAVSTKDIDRNDPGMLFSWVMDALMLGIGVGFDTLGQDKELEIYSPEGEEIVYEIPDTREGWVESLRLILNSYLRQNQQPIKFDYSLIRPAGEPIRGFGGTSSGPKPLIKLHDDIKKVIGGRAGETIDSRAIVDIVNLIGTCVVSGNVRRCLPANARVMTPNGYKEIQNIVAGDTIITGGEKHLVTGQVYSGKQDVIKITHRFGNLIATPNHRVAVFDSVGKYIFKNASDLSIGDRLVWDAEGYDGTIVELPKIKLSNHFNSKEFTIPDILDEEIAWLIGFIQGDGYISKNGIEITAEEKYIEALEKASDIFKRKFNVDNIISLDGKGHFRIRINRTDLAKWFRQFVKKPNTSIQIPSFIYASQKDVRGAYLMGLFDADGRTRKDGVIEQAATIYEEYAKDIVTLLSGLGIGSVVSRLSGQKRRNNGENVHDHFSVRVVGNINREKWGEYSQYSATRKISTIGTNSPVDFSWPYHMLKGVWHKDRAMTISTANKNNQEFDRRYLPTPVISIENVGKEETFDIEVADVHQFTTDGLVVHNSATLALGLPEDKDFINLKNPEIFPERNSFDSNSPGWAWMSNNSISAEVGTNYEQYVDLISNNGEPGFIWLDVTRNWGRTVDPKDGKDYRVVCYNPCAEQPLESYELCTLVEVHLNRHEDKADFLRTLKFAYLYGKTVTLLSTHWQQTNAIMQRNRRIGTSLTGIASFADSKGLPQLRDWMDEGYQKIRHYDNQYSEWLCVRESIRVTTVKPSGSVSILSGATPGVHWTPGGKYFMRAIRFGKLDPMLHLFKAAGYKIEDDLVSQNTSVVYFPVFSNHSRSEKDVTLFEKIGLAATTQKYWSDNGVSVTLSFDKENETKHIAPALHMYEGQLKAVSFLPMGNTVYPQQPYTQITEEEYMSYIGKIKKIDFAAIYDGIENLEAQGEKFCTNDSCEI